ncbi:POTRA domain-containing protein [uncultured Croceitalea sp.]|uniref:POTRA domain-containing protein n=1 Tax=uncultured Croceitalea sp. TaxID=1798908 RepID=UPI003305A3C9
MSKFFLILSFFLLTTYVCGQSVVANIKFQGNKKTKTTFLEKIVRLEIGAPLDSIALDNDVNRLKLLPAVAHAYYQVFETETLGAYNVYFGIEENFTIIPFANVYTSNNNEFAFRVGLQEFNFLGRNITLGGFYQYDIFNSVGVNIRAPQLFSKRLGLAINYQDLTTQEPVFLNSGTAEYRYNNESVEVLALYEFNVKHRLEMGLNFFTEDYQYLSGVTDTGVPQALNVDKYLYKLIYDFNDIKYYYYYLSGFRSILNLQLVRSQDQTLPDFTIGFNDFLYFKRVGERGNWANRLRFGVSSNIETPFAPFAVDNNLNIRGVGNLIDRGTAAIVLNTEYRHTLYEKDWFVVQGNVFVDGGSWRNPGGDFGDFADTQNLRIYPGVGIRFIHKKIFNAIFRIDYGHGVTKEGARGVVFGIGQYF